MRGFLIVFVVQSAPAVQSLLIGLLIRRRATHELDPLRVRDLILTGDRAVPAIWGPGRACNDVQAGKKGIWLVAFCELVPKIPYQTRSLAICHLGFSEMPDLQTLRLGSGHLGLAQTRRGPNG